MVDSVNQHQAGVHHHAGGCNNTHDRHDRHAVEQAKRFHNDMPPNRTDKCKWNNRHDN